jgi:hypothetical protein
MTRALTGTNQARFNGHPDFDQLLHPGTDEVRARVAALRSTYKLDPDKMKEVDDRYGPLDWRLPEAHAIYWAWLGLAKSKPQDLITLRRVIYQSMQLAFQRGSLRIGPNGQPYLSPNLEIVPNADAAYEEMARQEETDALRQAIRKANRNFLRQAVYELYLHNRLTEAEHWMKILRARYPDAVPANLTLADFVVELAVRDMQEGTQTRMISIIQALVTQSYVRLIEDADDEAAAYMQRAQEVWDGYNRKIKGGERLRLTPLSEVRKQVLDMMLDPKTDLPLEARGRLRTKLGLPAEAPPAAKLDREAPAPAPSPSPNAPAGTPPPATGGG